MTTTTTPPVPLPPGAVFADKWQPERYRVFEGEQRHITDFISVFTHGLQHIDGSIDNGSRREAPGIAVSGVNWKDAIDSETARRLADLLMMAADEIDRWAQR